MDCIAPSIAPSISPSIAPSFAPSIAPGLAPSIAPSISPSSAPSDSPTPSPTFLPTTRPTAYPFPPLHINQYGFDLILLLLVNILLEITTANLVDTIEHTKIESMIISWETYEYTTDEFENLINNNNIYEFKNIATEINAWFSQPLFTDLLVIIGNGEKGILPIVNNINRTANICNNGDYKAFPLIESSIVGTGNVIQIDFDRNTNMGKDFGNKNFRDVVVNYISSDLGYSVGAWQDRQALLLFVGYGPSTIGANSQFFIKYCVHDACIFIPEYLKDNELEMYYEWRWDCIQLSDNYECESEFIPDNNTVSMEILNRYMRGNEVYEYTIVLYDKIYDIKNR
jgi:hypothetical protein